MKLLRCHSESLKAIKSLVCLMLPGAIINTSTVNGVNKDTAGAEQM